MQAKKGRGVRPLPGESIGIDLGTSFSRVGVWNNGRVEVVAGEQGSTNIPSCVTFTNDSGILVGDSARDHIVTNARNTVFGAKCLLGKKFDDPSVQKYMNSWPNLITCGEDGKPLINVELDNQKQAFVPEQVSAMIVSKLKSLAEAHVGGGRVIKHAVVTVPSGYNAAQREATCVAVNLAGLEVCRVMTESTAAALAYGLSHKMDVEHNILVFHLAGGSVDVTLLAQDETNVFDVKASAGNSNVGGEAFNARLVEYLAGEFRRKHGVDVTASRRVMNRLHEASEQAKKTLSTSTTAHVELESLHGGVDFVCEVSRAQFEHLNAHYWSQLLMPVDRVLMDSGISKDKVNEVVMVGGSTRIPKVSQLLHNYFGRAPCQDVNAEEAVAIGATAQACVLDGSFENIPRLRDMLLLDVMGTSLGVETIGGAMAVVVGRNTTLPCLRRVLLGTELEGQTSVRIQLFAGEDPIARRNTPLGSLVLRNFPPQHKGQTQIIVEMDVDADGAVAIVASVKRPQEQEPQEQEMEEEEGAGEVKVEPGGEKEGPAPSPWVSCTAKLPRATIGEHAAFAEELAREDKGARGEGGGGAEGHELEVEWEGTLPEGVTEEKWGGVVVMMPPHEFPTAPPAGGGGGSSVTVEEVVGEVVEEKKRVVVEMLTG